MSDMARLPVHSYAEFTRHLGDREHFGTKLGVERIQKLLDRLYHPEQKFPSIHIAGTNGKGSTAYFLHAILMHAGYRAGLYTSPHLEDFCERIQVGGEKIRPERVLHWARVIQEVEEEPLTFFEMATVIALLHFAEEKVPVAILEVGLGGRLDATNVLQPLVSIITTIGMDHQHQLGTTLEAIAAEKGGIIKPGVPILCGADQPEVVRVIQSIAERQQAPLTFLAPLDDRLSLGPLGGHQRLNASLAVEAARLLTKQDYFIREEAITAGLAATVVPGRLEEISPNVLLDGAHNLPAVEALHSFLQERYPARRDPARPIHLLFGVMADKDWKKMLAVLAPVCAKATFVRPTLRRSEDPFKLQEEGMSLGIDGEVIPNIPQAVQRVIRNLPENGLLLVTGSFFTVGEARRYLRFNLKKF